MLDNVDPGDLGNVPSAGLLSLKMKIHDMEVERAIFKGTIEVHNASKVLMNQDFASVQHLLLRCGHGGERVIAGHGASCI